jgi:hypothetical protein
VTFVVGAACSIWRPLRCGIWLIGRIGGARRGVLVGCGEVQWLLDERLVACRGEVERLRVEAERIAELITGREAELVRLEVARQVVGELPLVHGVAVVAGGPRTEAAAAATVSRATGRA